MKKLRASGQKTIIDDCRFNICHPPPSTYEKMIPIVNFQLIKTDIISYRKDWSCSLYSL